MAQALLNLHMKESSQGKKGDSAHPDIFFNDISVERALHQDFGIYLDEKINFKCIGVIHQVRTQNFPEK